MDLINSDPLTDPLSYALESFLVNWWPLRYIPLNFMYGSSQKEWVEK